MVEQHDGIVKELRWICRQRIVTCFAIVLGVFFYVAQVMLILVVDVIIESDRILADKEFHASDGDPQSALTRHDLFEHGSKPKRREHLKYVLIEDGVGENRKVDFGR